MNREHDQVRMPDVSTAAGDLYGAALRSMDEVGAHRRWFIRTQDGRRHPLGADLRRWCGVADSADRGLLARSTGAVLDVGCGPGRLIAELDRLGRQAVGLDTSVDAVHLTRRLGGAVLRGSVFDPLPAEGRWDTVLLADGNVGIGGDPVALLARCRELITVDGRVLVELASSGTGVRVDRVRMEGSGETGDWFDWAHLSGDGLYEVAEAAGLHVLDVWEQCGRCFAALGQEAVPAEAGGPLELAS